MDADIASKQGRQRSDAACRVVIFSYPSDKGIGGLMLSGCCFLICMTILLWIVFEERMNNMTYWQSRHYGTMEKTTPTSMPASSDSIHLYGIKFRVLTS